MLCIVYFVLYTMRTSSDFRVSEARRLGALFGSAAPFSIPHSLHGVLPILHLIYKGPIGVVSCLSMPNVLLLKHEHTEHGVEHGQAADFSFIGE